jgi:serine carboxypeptidase-like clade 1
MDHLIGVYWCTGVLYVADTDACVPTVGTEEWTADLGFPVIREWQPWHGGTPSNATAHFVTSGYVIEYDAGTKLNPNHNFTFLTVKGAGHTVPEFKPIPMYQALMKFFNGEVIS